MKGSWVRLMKGCGVLAVASMFGGCLPSGGSSGGTSCDADEVRIRPAADLPRACYTVCETQADCVGSTTCSAVGDDLVCLLESSTSNNPQGCTSSAECSGATPVCSSGVCLGEDDPCALIDCEVGFVCREGSCVEQSTSSCTRDDQCGADEVCQSGACVEDQSGGECNFNSDCRDGELCQDGECVRDPNVECIQDRDCSGNGEVCRSNACIVPVEPGAQECVAYCQNLYGSCIKSECSGLESADRSNLDQAFDRCLNGGTSTDGTRSNPCVQDYNDDASFAQEVDRLGSETCGRSETLQDIYCGTFGFGQKCGCVEPSIGESCNRDQDCEGGGLTPICIGEADMNTGSPTGFDGGYCISGPCNNGSGDIGAISVGESTGCGTVGMCINVQNDNGFVGICYDQCFRNTECRAGYACEVLGFFSNGDVAGRCQPACDSNADCPSYTLNDGSGELQSFCNSDRWCEVPCNPSDGSSCGGGSGGFMCRSRSGFNSNTDFGGSCTADP